MSTMEQKSSIIDENSPVKFAIVDLNPNTRHILNVVEGISKACQAVQVHKRLGKVNPLVKIERWE